MTDSHTCHKHHDLSAGFGLIEVVLALLVASLGVLAAAGTVLGIGSQARLAQWDTDQALVAVLVIDNARRAGYASVPSGNGIETLGSRAYARATAVTRPIPGLEHISVTVRSALGRAAATFETRLAQPRPLPVAP